ncbi:MAG TPA: B12-binding domain-containing radical SAM protein [Bryobacteraceae bacterium]|nr:B12-binding domain-containing radical SAM protein [Bryobacteraceae bacterium]
MPLFPLLADERTPDLFPPLGSNLNVLLIWPKFPPSFWGFEGVLQMLPEAAMTPPLGLVTVAALCPSSWSLRLLDHAFDEIGDEDYRWADLVMVSAMHAQRVDAQAVLARARSLGKRTFIGGPWASSEPDKLRRFADHVLVGEAEEVFAGIAADLEQGTARAVYHVADKPDMSRSPIPRFDLLRREMYTSMPVQFSRGCPFQCEFCDIITIYGRKPRVKSPAQLIAELDTLRALGWRNEVFIVDDNFIGNSKNALQLVRELAEWGNRNGRVFSFYTEASVDLADRPELMAAMVEANFMYVFLGIESPSGEALKSMKKFQNLRKDNLEQIRTIQENGLWVLGGFIVGFDSDDETIFDRQREFIEAAGITWAMAGMLQAPPTTPLYDRMKKEGRLFEDSEGTSNFSAPNFRTAMPLPTLMNGLSGLLFDLYTPDAYFRRAFRSLQLWKTRPMQKPPDLPMSYNLRLLVQSMWTQGVRSSYRRAYWRFLWRLLRNYLNNPAKLWMGSMILLAGHHFLVYAHEVANELALAIPTSDHPVEPVLNEST